MKLRELLVPRLVHRSLRSPADGRLWRRVLILGMVFAFLVMPSGSSWAASLVVNSTADAVDANPGDGICATSSGVCTLRAAIQEANASNGADTITVPAGIY